MNRDQLLACLLAGDQDVDAISLDDDRYIDWSCLVRDEGGEEIGRIFEVGDSEVAANIEMTWPEIERLQRALTLALLDRKD